jgi:hypothetical protein
MHSYSELINEYLGDQYSRDPFGSGYDWVDTESGELFDAREILSKLAEAMSPYSGIEITPRIIRRLEWFGDELIPQQFGKLLDTGFVDYKHVGGRRSLEFSLGRSTSIYEASRTLESKRGIKGQLLPLPKNLKSAIYRSHHFDKKENLVMALDRGNHYKSKRFIASDGSCPVDRPTVLFIDFDTYPAVGYDSIHEFQEDIKKLVPHPVLLSPSREGIKIFVPVLIGANSSWNHKVRARLRDWYIDRFLGNLAPVVNMACGAKPDKRILDKTDSSTTNCFLSLEITELLMSKEVYPSLVIKPASDLIQEEPEEDPFDYRKYTTEQNPNGYDTHLLSKQGVKALVKLVVNQGKPKGARWQNRKLERDQQYEILLRKLGPRLAIELDEEDLSLLSSVQSSVYNSLLMTIIYGTIIKSGPAHNCKRPVQMYNPVLEDWGCEKVSNNTLYNWRLRLEGLGLLAKTGDYCRKQYASSYSAEGIFKDELNLRFGGNAENRMRLEIISNGTWNEKAWYLASQFKSAGKFIEYALNIKGIHDKVDRIYHFINAWNNSLYRDMKGNDLHGKAPELLIYENSAYQVHFIKSIVDFIELGPRAYLESRVQMAHC